MRLKTAKATFKIMKGNTKLAKVEKSEKGVENNLKIIAKMLANKRLIKGPENEIKAVSFLGFF